MKTISNPNWRAAFRITVLAAYFHAFMEWLFFVTKPSSLSILTIFEKVDVLFITGGVVSALLLAGFAIFFLISHLRPKWDFLLYIPAAFILSVTALILFDNFTYTVFKFGIVSTDGVVRALYTLGFIVAIWWMSRFARRTNIANRKYASFLTLGLLAVSTIGILTTYFSSNPNTSSDTSSQKADLPNIIILGGDGLSANYMSAYGYSLETTPFLEKLTKTSLVAENAFPNASGTTASTTSLLTGKEPITVKVLRYPDILSGNDSFEHLPGILKREGYQTVEIGTPYYVDAQKLNLLDGFDMVNNRSADLPALDALRTILGNSPSLYFIQTITERASERLLHIFFVREMQNPLEEVNSPKSRMNDDERTQQIIQALAQAKQPVFIFSHFMDTHGPEFSSSYHVFYSGSSDEAKEWDKDLYKDALLSFDSHVQNIYDYLVKSGKLNNTILLIYTDHGFGYSTSQRIPIIFHFPNDGYAGARVSNVQILDIPVTLLDYLDIPAPAWMVGTSMLGEEPPLDREIISIRTGSPSKEKPPFYQIKSVQVTVCERWFDLNVQENSWKSGLVGRHTYKCEPDILPTAEQVRQRILDYLQEHSYDISSLQ